MRAHLVRDDAVVVDWRHLSENDCEVTVAARAVDRCIFGLRLDPDEASYRQIKKGKQTRMCDFAVGGVAGTTARLAAVELKEGPGYEEHIEQLVEGLRVLHDYFPQQGLSPIPVAVFVVGEEADRLAFSLRDKLDVLKFGDTQVPLRVLTSGDVLGL